MTLQQLQYIVTLDKERNFVSAAQKCFVTQPALTVQLQKLEEELGVTIFDRTKKPLIPTEIGKEIIAQAKKIIRESEKIPDIVSSYKTELSGDLNLGIIPTVGQYLLPLFINAFINKYPAINVHVFEYPTEVLIGHLDNGKIDAGIISTPVPYSHLHSIPLFYEEMYVLVSPDHPLKCELLVESADLPEDDLWLLGEGHCFRNQAIRICRSKNNKKDLRFTYESNSIESLKRVVKSRQGITIIPEMASWEIKKSEKELVKKFKDFNPIREISLVVNRTFLKRQIIEKLQEEISLIIPAHMKAISERDVINPF
ncbi:MAG: LysR family transcriptional regulator [Calditrichae bacterium]|nr:LysR family transcriptional regulator [Calditrichia bacterium]